MAAKPAWGPAPKGWGLSGLFRRSFSEDGSAASANKWPDSDFCHAVFALDLVPCLLIRPPSLKVHYRDQDLSRMRISGPERTT